MKLLAFGPLVLALAAGSFLVLRSAASYASTPASAGGAAVPPAAVQEPRPAEPRTAPPANVFAPLFVRENAERIALTSEQRGELDRLEEEARAAVQAIHLVAAPLADAVAAAFEAERIDEEALLPTIDALLEQESRAHRAQLLLLVRVRNLLTAEQQKALGEIHDGLVF